MGKFLASWLFALLLGIAANGLVVSLPGGAAYAQVTASAPNYEDWEVVATRAEGVLVDRRASNVALGELRSVIVEWRTEFLNVQASNESRIQTVKSQIEALGPVPEEGTAESQDIASRRAELAAQLTQLEAPRIKSEEAFRRADGIIREIDTIIRERQAESLTQLGTSPLYPSLWSPAFEAVNGTLTGVVTEVQNAWASPTQQVETRKNLPIVLFFLVVALVLLGRGRYWMERLTFLVQGRGVNADVGVQSFVVSLGQVLVPVLGIWALSEAVFSTKLIGFRGQIILNLLPSFGIAIFGAGWLALRLFPKHPNRSPAINVPPETGRELRVYALLLGVLYALNLFWENIAAYENYSAETRSVLLFPLLALVGIILFRAGQVVRMSAPKLVQQDDHIDAADLRRGVTRILGRAMVGMGIVGPLLAAVGYGTAANFLMFPTVVSLALVGVLTVIQGVARDLYAMVTKQDDDTAKEALVPVLIGFGAIIASVPLFALIWGAQVSDLTELWSRFRAGFAVGDTRISPSNFFTFLLIFFIGYGVTRLVQGALRTSILPKTKIDPGGRTAIVSGLGYVGVFLAAIIAISAAGIDLSSLAIVAGALSVGIGFGLQNIVSNFVSGIILLIERPIAEGDWIEVGGQMGYVRDISVRSTRIETFDRTDVIIPNADLVSGTVTNYTRGNLIGRVIVPVGVAYGTDTQRVAKILTEIAEAHPLVTINPPPNAVFVGFGADSMDFEIRAILRDVNFTLAAKSEMNHEIARRFAEEGIEIPFAQRDVWLRNPEVLQATNATQKPDPKKP